MHSRGLGGLRLVCLEFLASFHLHGAVDDPVGRQRLQALHFHDHHLGGADTTAVTHPAHAGQGVKERRRVSHCSFRDASLIREQLITVAARLTTFIEEKWLESLN